LILRWQVRRAYIRLRPLRHWLRYALRPRWGLDGALWRRAIEDYERIMNPRSLPVHPLSIFAPDATTIEALSFNARMQEEASTQRAALNELRQRFNRSRASRGTE
jgi:hypothetical protein